MSRVDIRIEDIPQTLFDEIASALQHYVVPIYAISGGTFSPRLWWMGSGTLVEVAGQRSVLTAAHVWDAIGDADQIGLVLTAFLSAFTIPRDTISVRELRTRDNAEWGPDLALLTIPSAFVGRIMAHKSFLNLAQQRVRSASQRPNPKSLWAVTGAVSEFSTIAPQPDRRGFEGEFQARAFFSSLHELHERGDYDYIDTTAKLELPGVPSTFGGVSGGGLWELGGLSLAKSSGKMSWDGARYFRGVAFWESAPADGLRVIRFHGPRSVFETAWASWGMP